MEVKCQFSKFLLNILGRITFAQKTYKVIEHYRLTKSRKNLEQIRTLISVFLLL